MFIIALYFEQVLLFFSKLKKNAVKLVWDFSQVTWFWHYLSMLPLLNPQLKARITSHKAQFSGTPNLTVT